MTPSWLDPNVSRRNVLKFSGVAAVAVGSGILTTDLAAAATPNSLLAGGPGSLKALGRIQMPAVSGDFRVTFDYRYASGTMSGYYLFSSFDTAYRGPRLMQTEDRLVLASTRGVYNMDQPIAADTWHRFVLVFNAAGHVTIFVDGVPLTSRGITEFLIETGVTYTYYGYIGDLSTADFNGTAWFDNIEVRAGDTVTFEQRFDDGAPVRWTQMATAGDGRFGLADPAMDAEVPILATVELSAEPLLSGGQGTIRVVGATAEGRGVLVETESVQLTVDPAFLTVTPGLGGTFIVHAKQLGTTTVTAQVSQDGVTTSASLEVVIREGGDPAALELTAPGHVFVGDTTLLNRAVSTIAGGTLDPDQMTWEWTVEPSGVATVEGAGLLHAAEAGEITITATASNDRGEVSDTLELSIMVLTTAKTRASYWTEERRAVARENMTNLGWAASIRDSAVTAAAPYVALGPEKLWKLITSQDVPRSYGFTSNEQNGCLNCGTDVHAYGQYPYTADVWDKPWKLTCPSCKLDFPTNDFAAYYEGGLDAQGLFDANKAKRHDDELIAAGGTGNLINVLYPEKGETWGVDNGAGTVLEDGTRYTPIACYTHWKLWYRGELSGAIAALSDAYLYTGEVQYAEAGVVLLDRLADVYPSLNLNTWTYPDGYLNSNGNTSRGKVVGSIWETTLIRDWILAYDSFFPALADDATDPVSAETLAFLDGASKRMDKTNIKRIRRNIEDGLLREILPAVKRSEIRGNNGMHQATLAAAAVVLDSLPETDEMLAFNFVTGVLSGTVVEGGNLGSLFVDLVDRDGNGTEAAPGYNALWVTQFTNVADFLDGYRLEGMPNYDLYANPKYLKMFDGIYPLTMLGMYTPTIGDTGATGSRGLNIPQSAILRAYQKTGDPVYAQVLFALNGHTANGLQLGIFDADPEGVATEVQAVIDEHGQWQEQSRMLTGYGFAALRDGVPPEVQPNEGVDINFTSMAVTEQTKPTRFFESNGTTQFEAEEVGDTIGYRFTLTSAVQDTLSLNVWTAGSYGVYSVSVDDQVVAERFSFAGGGGAQTRPVGPVNLTAGDHTITFRLVDAMPGPKAGLRSMIIGSVEPGEIDHGTRRGSTMYFGRNTGHGHRDNLNIDHFAYGMDLLPDMGYPRYANSIDMHRRSLVINTIAHNTVVVDDVGQQGVVVGFPKLMDVGTDVQVVEVDTPQAYEQVEQYRRALVTVRIDDEESYLVDLFRVRGGERHLYSFHSMDATAVVTEGVELTPQQDGAGKYVGSYAGPTVPYVDTVNDPTGFSYFYDVDRRTGATGDFSVTWQQLKDTWNVRGGGVDSTTDVNVRLTLLGDHGDVALANCEPPQNKPGNPEQLRYLLAKSASSGESTFTGVIEPYRGERIVQGAQVLPVTTLDGAATSPQEVRAVRVTLPGGRVDTIVHAIDPAQTYLVDGLRFRGRLGVLTTQPDTQDRVRLMDGTEFGPAFGELDALTGTVASFTRELSDQNSITLTLDGERAAQVSADDLVGRYVFVEDDGVRNAVYRIEAVSSWSATQAVVSIGNVSPVRSYVDTMDFDKGFTYDLADGRAFRIPLRVTEPTDAAARLRELHTQFRTAIDGAGGPAISTLAEAAVRHVAANRMDAAASVVDEIVTKIKTGPIEAALSEQAYGWLAGTAEGWQRQLVG
ncbi:heparinase II/III domain-containing protein [Microlunatus sp. Y2014]|uniref:heparinase II/III domain-containing protein n=1 Tax=Microlunatus sp. Y2014 TaxID=3418488 RepID=UPI003DA76C52